MEAYGGARGNLLVVDFADLDRDAAATVGRVATWLGLAPHAFTAGEVFNSRKNRGVHAASPGAKAKTGGVISGVAKQQLGELGSWHAELSPGAVGLLREYYRRPNAELRALLGPERAMEWTRP